MPRPIWSGAISFGLVNVPVKVFSATSSKDVRFHQLDGKSKSRIKQKRVSVATGEEVPYEDLIKAYEIAPDNYVTITPEELEALDPKASKTIDIEDFVDLDQIDPVYYERPYYLVPDKGGQKAYALLRNAMRETNKVGIARVVLRTKQYLAAIRPKDDALVMETMLFADEVNPLDELDLPGPDVDVTEREEKMARSLIDSLTTDFEPDEVPRRVPGAGAAAHRAEGLGPGDRGRGRGRGGAPGGRPHGRPGSQPGRGQVGQRQSEPRPRRRSRWRSAAGSSSCPTSTRCCTPRPGSPRARSSTTTPGSRRRCCPTCTSGRSP